MVNLVIGYYRLKDSLLTRKNKTAGDQAEAGDCGDCEIFDSHNKLFNVVGVFDLRNRIDLENFNPVFRKTRMCAGLEPYRKCR